MRALVDQQVSGQIFPVMKLKDCATMQYGYTETAVEEEIGPKFVRITDIAQEYLDWDSVPFCHCSHENHLKYALHEGDVLVARTGATVGYAKMIGSTIPDSVFASFLVRITPNDREYRHFLGMEITSKRFLEYVQTNAGGSAQPQANPPLLGEYQLEWPTKQFLSSFEELVAPFLASIEHNETEISKLRKLQNLMVQMLSSC